MTGLTVLAQRYSWIALIIHKGGQELCHRVFKALYAPHITDKVFAAIALYLPPFLIRQVFYSVYCNHFHSVNNKVVGDFAHDGEERCAFFPL